jgi:hypothetical protein
MDMKKLSRVSKSMKTTLIAATLLVSSNAYAATIPADILWLIDVSVSMGNDITQIRTRIGQFETAMNANSIDASYGLIEFGGNVSGSDDWAIVTDMTSNFATFTAGLNSISANHGNPESGSSAGFFGLNNITWTNGSVKNLILVTDEDDDSDGQASNAANTCTGGSRPECNAFHNELTAENALFNVIRSPGAGNTTNTYDFLASQHGGTAFSIALFRADPTAFFDNFIDTKVEEIKNTGVVPIPAGIWLFGTALIGFVGMSRRRKVS